MRHRTYKDRSVLHTDRSTYTFWGLVYVSTTGYTRRFMTVGQYRRKNNGVLPLMCSGYTLKLVCGTHVCAKKETCEHSSLDQCPGFLPYGRYSDWSTSSDFELRLRIKRRFLSPDLQVKRLGNTVLQQYRSPE